MLRDIGTGERVGGQPRRAGAAMTVLLRSAEVDDLMDLRTAMTVLERTYVDQADGQVKAIPPLRLMDRGIRLVAGGLDRADRVGLRVSATGGDALALVYEMSSGKLLSIMNYPFSSLRIAATVGLALDRLAAPEVRSAALIGSGRLAPALLQAATGLRPIERVSVYSRNAQRREAFATTGVERVRRRGHGRDRSARGAGPGGYRSGKHQFPGAGPAGRVAAAGPGRPSAAAVPTSSTTTPTCGRR